MCKSMTYRLCITIDPVYVQDIATYILLDFVENQTSFMKKREKKYTGITFPKLSSQRKVSTSIINFFSAGKFLFMAVTQ